MAAPDSRGEEHDEPESPSDEAGGSQDERWLREVARAPAREPGAASVVGIGEVLGRYRVVRLLGRGAFGVVYEARDHVLGRRVALKVFSGGWAADEKGRRRFLREAQVTAALSHPNIAAVHDAGESEGRVFLVMELVQGRTLRDVLREGALPAPRAVAVARAIALALAHAHAHGIVHRDLKPENVMLGAHDAVKVLDFGLATRLDAALGLTVDEEGPLSGEGSSMVGSVVGTPGYLAPEQATGDALDARADVFALGAILYEMLAGEPAYPRRAGPDPMRVTADVSPVPLASRAPSVPASLARTVMRCLEREPSRRFARCEDVVAALDRATPGSRPLRRAWWAVAVALVASVGAFAAPRLRGPAVPSGQPSSNTAARGVAGADGGRGVAITDHPPPKSSVPEAAAAYALGLQLFRDGEPMMAAQELRRAARLDPTMAAANLRATLHNTYQDKKAALRALYAAAFRYRSALDERDRLLLAVAELVVADAPDYPEWTRRARAVTDRFPDDAEAWMTLGLTLEDTGEVAEARRAYDRAVALDPQFALPLFQLAHTYRVADPERALALLGQCLELSPGAGVCLRERVLVAGDQLGDCVVAEAAARRLLVVLPDHERSYHILAHTLAALSPGLDGVRDALDRRAALTPDEGARRVALAQRDLWLAMLDGDLAEAEARARALDAAGRDSVVESDHAPATDALFDAILERGDVAKALEEADAYERRSAAWTKDAPTEIRMRIALIRNAAGKLDDAAFARERASLLAEAPHDGVTRVAWRVGASWTLTPHQATAWLREVGDGEPPEQRWYPELAFGRALLLAGEVDRALPYLRRSARSCAVLGNPASNNTLPWIQAHVLLGEALEKTGDGAGACAAYAEVLRRWGRAKPRSVSADEARERTKALRCAR